MGVNPLKGDYEMKTQVFHIVCSFILTIPIFSWILYKAISGFTITESDMWTVMIVPLYVMSWTSSKEKGILTYNLFLIAASVCTALDIYWNTSPSVFLLTTTMIGNLLLPIRHGFNAIRSYKKTLDNPVNKI
jgi:hypothetical protein